MLTLPVTSLKTIRKRLLGLLWLLGLVCLCLNSATLGLFQTNSTTVYYSNRENSEEFEVFSRDRWNAAEAKDVPESSAIAGLALLAVGGCLLKRKAACS